MRQRAALRKKANRMGRRICRMAAVRSAWLGVRARRLAGHVRTRWPVQGGRELVGPGEVLASLAQRLDSCYGARAVRATEPEELWELFDAALEGGTTHYMEPLLESAHWAMALAAARRSPTRAWRCGADGLRALDGPLSEQLRRAF